MDSDVCTCFVTAPNGDDVELEVSYEAYYLKGKLYGPPENCYPPEGELNVTSISPDIPLTQKQKDLIEERCWEHYMDHKDDGYDPS